MACAKASTPRLLHTSCTIPYYSFKDSQTKVSNLTRIPDFLMIKAGCQQSYSFPHWIHSYGFVSQ